MDNKAHMHKTSSNKATRKYVVIISALFPFLLLMATGIILLIYHTGKSPEALTLGIKKNNWLSVHQISAIISAIIIGIHLIQHVNWFKKVFTGKLKSANKELNLTLLAFLLIAMITGFSSWFWAEEEKARLAIMSIHNKFGLFMIVMFVIHLKNYFRWIVSMTKKFRKNEVQQV